MRCHKLLYEAQLWLTWKGFIPWISSVHPFKHTLIHELDPFIEELCESITPQRHDVVYTGASCKDVAVLFEDYLYERQHNSGTVASFWISYSDIENILLPSWQRRLCFW